MGIGKAVMHNIIAQADSQKKRILLQVFKINVKAQKFYRQLGFIKNFETENHIGMIKASQQF